jgi:quaternary ammonium compound-resistance protein SugE
MAWIVLFVAGLFEVGWAVGLKYTEGFSCLWPSVGTVTSMIVSLGLLGMALRTLPLRAAYAIWTGVGTVSTALLGIMLFHEAADPIRPRLHRPHPRRDRRSQGRDALSQSPENLTQNSECPIITARDRF